MCLLLGKISERLIAEDTGQIGIDAGVRDGVETDFMSG